MKRTKYPCLKPISAWRCGYTTARDGIVSDKIIFSYSEALEYYQKLYGSVGQYHLQNAEMHVDCGKCVHCLLRRRRDMSIRLQHERSLYKDACFITLTYNDDSLPLTDLRPWSDGYRKVIDRGDLFGVPTLVPADVQKFLKRLRRHLEYIPVRKTHEVRDHVETPIRFFAVGEYGSKTSRPHYHIIIFGWSPSDMIVHERRRNYNICRSKQIEKLWKHGFSTVCGVMPATCAYCARYVCKKFRTFSSDDLDGMARCPEFVLQSVRKGGMGASWIDRFANNLKQGCVTVRGSHGIIKQAVPRYYFDRLRKHDRKLWLELRDQRLEFVSRNSGFQSDGVEETIYCEEIGARFIKLLYEWEVEDLRSVL